MSTQVSSPVAVVTGASRGLGAALTAELADRGFRLALCATSAPDLPGALCRTVDVGDPRAVLAFASETRDRLGPISLWVNNAAILGPVGSLRDLDPELWTRCLAVNVGGTVAGSRGLLEHRAGIATLVNIASRAGIRGVAGLSAYSATKAAVIALTVSIAAEENDSGLRALVVIPPSIDTDMQNHLLAQAPDQFPGVHESWARRDAGQIVSAQAAAKAILEAVIDDEARGPIVDLTESSSM